MTELTNGIVVGVVTSLDDPADLGRVRVKYPHLGNRQSDWARLSAPMAGPNRGLFMRPEVGDEVLVVFVQCDAGFPCIVGSLWSTVDRPPTGDGKKKENNWRFLRSRSGHLFKFDDTPGSEKIELQDKDGKRRVVIESAGDKIRIECDAGDVSIKATAGKVSVEAGDTVQVKAKTVDVRGDAEVKLSAPSISVKANGTLDLQAGGALTIKGSIVKIN